MAKPKTITAQHLFDFRDVVGDRYVIATTVGPVLNPIILSMGTEPDYRVVKASGIYPKKRAAQLNDFRIHYGIENEWLAIEVHATDENWHAVQPLGTDQWLLVRCRASNSSDRNAHVVDADGRKVHCFHAGDGIEDVQVTTDSKIWISYFDEGVFSGLEMGHSGLVCLDDKGKKEFDFGQVVGRQSSITDCYALNVSGNHEAWLYYYTDFPLVRLADFQFANSWPRMPVSGSHAFAVTKGHVLFFGSYKDRRTLFQVSLSTLRVQKLTAVSTEGKRIRASAAFGRATNLYLVTDDSLFLVDWHT